MRILVIDKDTKHKIRLWVPSSLLGSRIACGIAYRAINKSEKTKDTISKEQLKVVFKELRHCVRSFQGLTIVDVKTSDGERVKISL